MSRSQLSTITPFTLAKQAKMTDLKKNSITGSICRYIIKSLRPFSTVEDPYFRAMCHDLNPNYVLPDRHDVSERIIPKMYEIAMKCLKED